MRDGGSFEENEAVGGHLGVSEFQGTDLCL